MRTSHCRNGITSFAVIGRRCIGLANRFADGPYRKPKRAIWKNMWLSESFKGVALGNSVVIAGIAYPLKIGRASCRERVCQYVLYSVVAGNFKKQSTQEHDTKTP